MFGQGNCPFGSAGDHRNWNAPKDASCPYVTRSEAPKVEIMKGYNAQEENDGEPNSVLTCWYRTLWCSRQGFMLSSDFEEWLSRCTPGLQCKQADTKCCQERNNASGAAGSPGAVTSKMIHHNLAITRN
ncbi:hypothetical protein NQ318_015985 [Aromia moschata]|uniref:Uncharacterized protein n=1 Tax=Aromia moschata TaxID=1265417 RepID=A0AAV8X0Q4_9CUCU|nr:hypothetical protein NQ318_015985 [Aromia moschata]